MGIALVVVIGLVAMTLVAVVGDGLTKIGIARAKSTGPAASPAREEELGGLSRRIALLESRLDERDEGIRKLQEELHFVSRMLEDKSGPPA